MDFGRPHVEEEGVVVKSGIRVLPTTDGETSSLDDLLVRAANDAARNLFQQEEQDANSRFYTERFLPRTAPFIQEGDLVVIFESFDRLTFLYATRGQVFCNRNGRFPHNDFIDCLPFGAKLRSSNHRGYGFVYLLKPTPELWARSLSHRTQIVHELDASMICHHLDLRPNCIVCESGTGSGALSHGLLRTIAPKGHLHTYEFHEARANQARAEFAQHGVSHLVTVHHRDVCNKDGKGGGFLQEAHAVMLDLPEPWLVVPHAATCLQARGGRFASYSPCVEQAQKTTLALQQHGFFAIRTLEFRLREHHVDRVDLTDPPTAKRPRTHNHNTQQSQETTPTEEPKMERKRMICTRPFPSMRGHTAFLTFATMRTKRPTPKQAQPHKTQKHDDD